MPFTPYHFGINGTAALTKPKKIDLLSCILANVVLDVQPFLVIFFGVGWRLHGVSHTFLFASVVCTLIFTLWGLFLKKIFKVQKDLTAFSLGGFVGGNLHVLVDSLLYQITPFYPFSNATIQWQLFENIVFYLCFFGYLFLGIYLLSKKDKKTLKKATTFLGLYN